jgi:hypothetical protein
MNVMAMNQTISAAQLRTALRGWGWVLLRAPRYDRESGEHNAYFVYDGRWQRVVFGEPFGTSLEAIRDWLDTLPTAQQARSITLP